MKHIKPLKRWKFAVPIMFAFLTFVFAFAFSTMAVVPDNSNVGTTITADLTTNLADHTNPLATYDPGALTVSADLDMASTMTYAVYNEHAALATNTGIAGDADTGGNVIACKNAGAIILAISDATYDTKTTLDPILG